MMRWRRALTHFALLGLGFAVPLAHAQRTEATEASVKAAFLYKFAGYIEWPESLFSAPDAPFVVGVLRADELASDLARIVAGRAIGGHPVTVRRMKDADSLKGVHLLFIGKAESARLASILRAAQQQSLLTVTEHERGLEWGSVINFVVAEERVGFEVSLEAAEKSGHRISSRMLQVARRVVAKLP